MGDFNHGSLSSPHQYVDFPTRGENQHDLAYCNLADSFKAHKLPPLASSDHYAVELRSIYITRHKLKKPAKVVTKHMWDEECLEKLKCELETTDGGLLLEGDVNSAAELITDNFNFLIITNIPTKQVKIRADNK